MPGDLLSDTSSEAEEGEFDGDGSGSEFSSFDAGEVEAPDDSFQFPNHSQGQGQGLGQGQGQYKQGAPPETPQVFRGSVPTAPSPKSQKTPAKASPVKPPFAQQEPAPSTSRPSTARPQSAAAGASTSTGNKAGSEAKQHEQNSESSMAHLAELYSKQGKDLYSSGSYTRYSTSLHLSAFYHG